MSNIITAAFDGETFLTTERLWKGDYGQILNIQGLELPEYYEVHFASTKDGSAQIEVGTATGVTIPNKFLRATGYIYAWLFLHEGENDGETKYQIKIPVEDRGIPIDQETPQEKTAVQQAIEALNEETGKAETAAEEALGYASDAETAKSLAEAAQAAAEAAVDTAEAAQAAASESETNAAQSASAAQSAAETATQKASAAASSASSARSSATSASSHSSTALAAASNAVSASTRAQNAQTAAEAAHMASEAAQSAAEESAGEATQSSAEAATSAGEAAQSATAAAESATAAATSASAAAASESAAEAAQAAAEAVLESIPEDYSALSAEVEDLKNAFDAVADMEGEPAPYEIGGIGYVKIADGDIASGSTFAYTDYVDVSSFGAISYKRHKSTSANPTGGMAFYNASKVFVSSVPAVAGQSSAGYANDLYSVSVPDSAKYARFTTYADTTTYGSFAVYGERKAVTAIKDNASDIADVREIVTEAGVVATGVAARIEAATAGAASCTTDAATVIRYRKNLRTRETAPTNVHLSTDENGAWVLTGSIGANSYYIDLQTGIKLTGGVTYRVDGSPRTSDSAGLCLYVGGTRYAYDNNKNGATYTPATNVSADLKLRVMANATYDNVKFYPVVCENATAKRSVPNMLELLSGKNEVIGLNFLPLTVTYNQDKLQVLDDKVDSIVARDFTMDDIMPYEDEDGYIISSFAVMMRQPFWTNGRIVGIVSQHIEGETKANLLIQLCDSSGSSFYTSRRYDIGGSVEAVMQEFKCPPSAKTNVLSYDHVRVSVTVPTGTKLKISNFYSFEAGQSRHNDDCGIKWHAHAGFSSLCPSNSIPSFQYAGKLGFTSCITIPKFTSDGIGVCFHDDGSISGDLVWMDGSEITGDDDIGIANYSYEYITQNFRLRTSWGTLHVPTIDDFFRICSMCNMAPIFSVHSTGFGMSFADGFAYIRQLAVKWNVLKKLWIKSGSASVQSAAFEVFGTDMAGMILIRGQSSTWDPLAQAKLIVNNNGDHVLATTAMSAKEAIMPLVFELFHAAATDEAIAIGISEGFKVSIATTDAALTGPVMMTYIGKGVTEFTDDYHCSLGLDWTCR